MARIIIEPEEGDEFEKIEYDKVFIGAIVGRKNVSLPIGGSVPSPFSFYLVNKDKALIYDLLGDMYGCMECLRGNLSR